MISCVLCTYGRMQYVERSISFYLSQDFKGESELIIYNTDVDHPINIIDKPNNIRIINNNIDFITNQPYTNIGAIRRDALRYTSGRFFITWDDDDIYLPWAIRQRYTNIIIDDKKAWKPSHSFFMNHLKKIELTQNTFEASCIVDINEVTFNLETGSEAVGKNAWYTRLRDMRELDENSISIPDYGFEWYDHFNLNPHRQSGDINNPNNFENHKFYSTDYHIRPIKRIDVSKYYDPYFKYIENNKDRFNIKYFNKYYLR